MKQLIRIASIGKLKKDLKIRKNLTAKKVMPAHTEATVTPNVRKTSESVFSEGSVQKIRKRTQDQMWNV